MEERSTETPALLRFFAAIGIGALVGYIIYLLWLYRTPVVVLMHTTKKDDNAAGDTNTRDSVARPPVTTENHSDGQST